MSNSKLFRKILAAAIAGIMLVSVVSGCGKTEKPEQNSTVASTKEESKPELKVLRIWSKDDLNTYPVAKVLEEKTGYHVVYEMLPQDKPEDKLNIIMASAEPYDLINTAGQSNFQAIYSDYSKRGALTEITPLLDKYGQNLKSSITQESFDIMKVDGKIYAVPTQGISNVGISLGIRQDWLDKLNMQLPTTLDEFTNMLKAFKEKDPGGNGADKNIGITISSGTPVIENIRGAFGIPNSWNDVDGKLVCIIADPAFKDYLTYITDLYKQGLIDKEFGTNKEATYKEKLTNGRAGVSPVGWSEVPTLSDTLKKNFPDSKFVIAPALKGKDGKFGLRTTSGVDSITFIPKSSKHPEDAMKWMNAKLDKDTFKLMAIGEEGKHYTYQDGAYNPILPIFNDERGQANCYLTGIDEKNYPTYWQARVRKDMRLFDAWDYMNNKLQADTGKVDLMGYAPYLPEYSKNNQQLTTMINDYVTKVIVGGEPISGLDAFVQKWKSAGGETVTKEINDWYTTRAK